MLSFSDERGYTLVELVIVIAILGIVMLGLTTLFVSGVHSQTEQGVALKGEVALHVGMNRLRLDVHAACSATAVSATSLTVSLPPCDGSQVVTWCTQPHAGQYSLYRNTGSTCGGVSYADYLTGGAIFTYTPQNSPAGSYALPRVHVDITVNANPQTSAGSFHVVDDIAFRNGARR